MQAPRLPTIGELELSSDLRNYFLKHGGKSGVVPWISRKTGVPSLPHNVLTKVALSEIKKFARKYEERGVLIRSDNHCEILPGTEGLFSTWHFYSEDDVNDEYRASNLKKIPACPRDHLKQDWPTEVKCAAVEDLHPDYYCNLIEHPNQEGAFWMTITQSNQRKVTIYPGIDLDNPYYKEELEKFQRETEGGLEKITDAAKKIVGLEEFDRRYAKQIEFILKGKEFYLAQAKIFCPKNPTKPETNPETKDTELYRTLGVFDVEALVEIPEEGRIQNQPVIRFVQDLSEASMKGIFYRNNVEVTIFEDATGLLEHHDMPYLIYSQGIAIGDYFPQALDKSGKPFKPKFKHGQKIHVRSDGHYLYVLN